MKSLEPLTIEELGAFELASTKAPQRVDFWQWAFGDNQQGACGLGIRDSANDLVGYIAALRVPVLIHSEAAELLHVIAANFETRETLNPVPAKQFILLAEQFARTYGGNHPESAPLLYGLPSPAIWNLAKTALSAKVMRTQALLACDAHRLNLPATGSVEVVLMDRFPEQISKLKQRAASLSEIVSKPTASALNHRFVDLPSCKELESEFQIALARKNGEYLGYAVFAVDRSRGSSDRTQVWDWCVPESRAASIELLASLRDWAIEREAPELRFWLPDTQPEWIALQHFGFRVSSSHLALAVRHFPRQMTMRWLYHNWNYDLSDWMLHSKPIE